MRLKIEYVLPFYIKIIRVCGKKQLRHDADIQIRPRTATTDKLLNEEVQLLQANFAETQRRLGFESMAFQLRYTRRELDFQSGTGEFLLLSEGIYPGIGI